MEIILKKLNGETWKCFPSCLAGFHIAEALTAWLAANGIYLGDLRVKHEAEVNYNDIYHFYSWSLFFWDKCRRTAIEKIPEFFRSKGYKVETLSAWHNHRAETGVEQIPGLTIWLYPKQ